MASCIYLPRIINSREFNTQEKNTELQREGILGVQIDRLFLSPPMKKKIVNQSFCGQRFDNKKKKCGNDSRKKQGGYNWKTCHLIPCNMW